LAAHSKFRYPFIIMLTLPRSVSFGVAFAVDHSDARVAFGARWDDFCCSAAAKKRMLQVDYTNR